MFGGGKGRRIALQIQTCIEYQGCVVDYTVKIKARSYVPGFM